MNGILQWDMVSSPLSLLEDAIPVCQFVAVLSGDLMLPCLPRQKRRQSVIVGDAHS